MKTITLFIGVLLAAGLNGFSNNNNNKNLAVANTPVCINSTVETNSIAKCWAEAYNKLNGGEQISILELNNDQPVNGNIGIVDAKIADAAQWKILIGRSAIVPVINKNNPLIDELNRSGVSAQKLLQLMSNPQDQDWGSLLNNSQNIPAKIYTVNEKEILGSSEGSTIRYDEIITKVQEDIFAIGFCNLPDILSSDNSHFIDNIAILPIDKNNNGRLDSFEKIYNSAEDFVHGVWIGKYPSRMTKSIFAVSTVKPSDKATISFLSWIISDGQKVLNENGYIMLKGYQGQASLDMISNPVTPTLLQPQESETSFSWVFTLAAIIIIGVASMIIYSIVKMFTKSAKSDAELINTKSLRKESILAPNGLYYGKSHTWSFMEKDGTVKVGIDDFIQRVAGTLTKIKMKESGEAIRKGEKMLSINHDGKQLDIYAPVSGIIKEQNQALNNDSSLINRSPYADGWVYTIIPKNWAREIEFMFFGQDYQEWLTDEFSRLKDFLAGSVKQNAAAYQHIILQDGGELTENVLADLDPKVWEDFQTKFLDISK